MLSLFSKPNLKTTNSPIHLLPVCPEAPDSTMECKAFLSDMPDRYAQADLVISRAGASSISEICLLGKAAILVPSPNVAEDHQTHNAMALVNKNAAVLVRDADATQQFQQLPIGNQQAPKAPNNEPASLLVQTALSLIKDDARLAELSANARAMAQTDSARRIAEEVIRLASGSRKICDYL